ncbi:unnamed protein product [Sphagnum jensenii]|uniref:RING-type domain-containing protein n=1 Tax=Sphagnum jensenii TaxID=128206 RepID=A0ABP1A618_9BRYO
MSKEVTSLNTGSSDSMSSLTAKKQPQQQHDGEGGGRRGLKRQKREASSSSSSSESDSSASRRRRHQQQGVSNNNNELLQLQQQQSEAKAAGSVTPNKNVMSNNNLQVVTESAAKPIAEAGPGLLLGSQQKKKLELTLLDTNDLEAGALPREGGKMKNVPWPSSTEDMSPSRSTKRICRCTKCRGPNSGHKEIVWNKLVSKQLVQGKNNKVAADGQLNRNGKRARRAGKEKEDDSSTKLPMQSKSKDMGDAKSKDSDILPQDYYSRGDSKSRDSWKSKLSLDGQTELLQSLVHAVHAEDKVHKEKRQLKKESRKFEEQKNILAIHLNTAMRAVHALKEQTKQLQKAKKEALRQLQTEKAALEKTFHSALKDEQERISRVLEKFECAICAEELEGSYSKRKRKKGGNNKELKQRACFRPCNHAGACVECAVNIWEKTKKCPFCDTKLSGKPAALHF